MPTVDFLIIGGGVIGLNIARRLRQEFGDVKTLIVEKEPDVGLHASGRNSEVLHAGFYYTPDVLRHAFRDSEPITHRVLRPDGHST